MPENKNEEYRLLTAEELLEGVPETGEIPPPSMDFGDVALNALYSVSHGLGLATLEAREEHQQKKEQTLRADTQEYLATHDELTGLPNRRGLNSSIEARVSQTPFEPFLLVKVDLGNFKGVNDKFGHGTGDEVLREVAIKLRETVRQADKLGSDVIREGGDEFVVLLADFDSSESRRNAEDRRVGEARKEEGNRRSAEDRRVGEKNNEDRIAGLVNRLFLVGKDLKVGDSELAKILRRVRFSIAAGGVVYDPNLSFKQNMALADEKLYETKANIRKTHRPYDRLAATK